MRYNGTILYAEDDILLGQMTSKSLTDSGYTVTWVTTMSKTLESLFIQKFDACLLDIMLPDGDGYELVKKIRASHFSLPVIFLTGRTLTDDIVKGFTSGANDYIKKPYQIDELNLRIQSLINYRLPTGIPSTISSIGKYAFNQQNMELRINGTVFRLSYQESEILKYLNSNRNEISFRKDMLTTIWGTEELYFSRSLDVYISKLRKYLSDDKSISIRNIRGLGYTLQIC